MNERIRELAVEATKYSNTLMIDYLDLSDEDYKEKYNQEYNKKFAELIVRECSNMCYKASQESFRLNEVKAGAMGMALKVLMEEHFGVEL